MRRLEQATAILILALAGVIVVATTSLSTWSGFTPGARFMPLVVSGLGAALAIVQLVSVTHRPDTTPADWPRGSDAHRVLLLIAAIAAFVAVTPSLGIVSSAFLFTIGLLILVLRRPALPSLLTATIVAAIIWIVFVAWLGLRLPAGPLGF